MSLKFLIFSLLLPKGFRQYEHFFLFDIDKYFLNIVLEMVENLTMKTQKFLNS